MTADRFEIIDDGPCIRIVSPDCPTGYHIDDAIIGAIRQQARDIAELRADLAAAVAQIEGDFSGWRAVERRWKTRAERAEARLAAIDAAPTVARIESLPGPRGGAYLYIMGVESPPNVSSGTELIARLAKD